MDSITQGALGAACAQMFFGKRSKHIPWIAGALSGMAADLDIFIRSGHNPLSIELWHRSFSHSLIFIPIGGLLVALSLMIFPLFRAQWKLTAAVCLVGYATHGILDAFTTYGTLLFWPWSTHRVSWDIISIVDPVFTLPLILGTIGSVHYNSQKFIALSLAWSICFMGFNAFQHQRALNYMHHKMEQTDKHLSDIRAIPTLASSTHWRVIGKKGSCYYLADLYTPLWRANRLTPLISVKRFTPSMLDFSLTVNQKKELDLFAWFADDYLIVAKRSPLILLDGRYTTGSKPLKVYWGIKLEAGQEHVSKVGQMSVINSCDISE